MRRPVMVLSQIGAFLLVPVMLLSIWLHIQVLDNHRYTESMRELGSDASFQAALGDQVSRLLNAEITKLANSSFASQYTSYVEEFGGIDLVQAEIVSAVNELIQSPNFVPYWVTLNQTTHQQLVQFLRGEGSALTSDNRHGIALDLAVIADWVDPFVDEAASQLLELAESDGVTQIPIAESRSFPLAEWFSRNSLAVAIGSSALFIALQVIAIYFADRRKNALVIAAVGIAVAAGLTLVAAKTFVSDHLAQIRDLQGRALAHEYVDALLSDLVMMAIATGIAALVIGAVLAALPFIRQTQPQGHAAF
jgi:hypothetical protein